MFDTHGIDGNAEHVKFHSADFDEQGFFEADPVEDLQRGPGELTEQILDEAIGRGDLEALVAASQWGTEGNLQDSSQSPNADHPSWTHDPVSDDHQALHRRDAPGESLMGSLASHDSDSPNGPDDEYQAKPFTDDASHIDLADETAHQSNGEPIFSDGISTPEEESEASSLSISDFEDEPHGIFFSPQSRKATWDAGLGDSLVDRELAAPQTRHTANKTHGGISEKRSRLLTFDNSAAENAEIESLGASMPSTVR